MMPIDLINKKSEHKSAEPLECGGLAPLFFLETKSGAKPRRSKGCRH
jgi:hypothetical protein